MPNPVEVRRAYDLRQVGVAARQDVMYAHRAARNTLEAAKEAQSDANASENSDPLLDKLITELEDSIGGLELAVARLGIAKSTVQQLCRYPVPS